MGRVKTPPLGGGGLACWPPGQGGAGSGSQPWPGLWQALLSTAATSVTRHPCFCLPLATTPCAHIARPHAPPGCPRGSPLLAPSSEGPRFSCHPRADSHLQPRPPPGPGPVGPLPAPHLTCTFPTWPKGGQPHNIHPPIPRTLLSHAPLPGSPAGRSLFSPSTSNP